MPVGNSFCGICQICICHLCNTITSENLAIGSSFLVCGYILRGYGSNLCIVYEGHQSRSRSQEQKKHICVKCSGSKFCILLRILIGDNDFQATLKVIWTISASLFLELLLTLNTAILVTYVFEISSWGQSKFFISQNVYF